MNAPDTATTVALAAGKHDAPNRGQRLEAIMRDLDATSAVWVAAGYPLDGPEWGAREAVFARLREWNADA